MLVSWVMYYVGSVVEKEGKAIRGVGERGTILWWYSLTGDDIDNAEAHDEAAPIIAIPALAHLVSKSPSLLYEKDGAGSGCLE